MGALIKIKVTPETSLIAGLYCGFGMGVLEIWASSPRAFASSGVMSVIGLVVFLLPSMAFVMSPAPESFDIRRIGDLKSWKGVGDLLGRMLCFFLGAALGLLASGLIEPLLA
jgi:hypothetical protein